MQPKPAHLEARYAEQFGDDSVADAYACRPPYPVALYPLLLEVIGARPRSLLDLGCGTGEISRRLAPDVDHIDAVDPSAPMLQRARAGRGGSHPSLYWHCSTAEAFALTRRYSAALAAESFHWLDWPVVIERLKSALDGPLILVTGRSEVDSPWAEALARLFPRFSTNREYRAYDLLRELEARDLFRAEQRVTLGPSVYRQSIATYVESFHSRNGFSRARMSAADAAEFDRCVAEAIRAYTREGEIEFRTLTEVAWGRLSCPE